MWSGEYLGSLREQHSYVKNKNHPERDMICVGDVVLVSENTPRIKWKYGLVEELIRGKDKKIRGACVLIKNKDLKISYEDQSISSINLKVQEAKLQSNLNL